MQYSQVKEKCMKHIRRVWWHFLPDYYEHFNKCKKESGGNIKKQSSMQWVSLYIDVAENVPKWPNLYPWAAAVFCVGNECTEDTGRGRRCALMMCYQRASALDSKHKGKGGLKGCAYGAYLSLDFRMTAGSAALLPDSFIPSPAVRSWDD